MTDKAIKNIVKLALAGKIFGSWQMTPEEIRQHGTMVFMPVALGAEIPDGVAHAYAPIDDRVSSSGINGLPFFSSVAWIMDKDWGRFVELMKEAQAAQAAVLD